MKYRFWLFLVVSMCVWQDGAMAAADTLFAAGKYEAALAAYEKQENHEPAELMRMGECAVSLKRLPIAAWYWQRALRRVYGLSFFNLATRLHALRVELGLATAAPAPFWYVATFFGAIPPLFWQVIVLLLLGLAAWQATRWWQRRRWLLLISFAVSLVLSTALSWVSLSLRQSAIAVTASALTVRAGPDARFLSVASLPAGCALAVRDVLSLPGAALYYRIATDEVSGWALADDLLLV